MSQFPMAGAASQEVMEIKVQRFASPPRAVPRSVAGHPPPEACMVCLSSGRLNKELGKRMKSVSSRRSQMSRERINGFPTSLFAGRSGH